MTSKARKTPKHGTTRGFSLVELMVALLIGLFLMGGALTIYMQSRNTYRTTDTVARLQEVGRYALDIIEPDVRLAGYWGMRSGSNAVTSLVTDAQITNYCATNWIASSSTFIEGRDASYGLSCAASDRATWSDTLIVRRAEAATAALDASKVQVQSNRTQATIFAASSIPTGYAASPGSETRDLVVNVYYVSDNSGRFALRRRALRGLAMTDEEVVPGIEDLQVQFGVDRDGDGTADQYVNPNSVGVARVVAARIWIMVTADEPEIGFRNTTNYQYANANYSAFGDNLRRIVLSKTIQIRNSR